MSTRLTTGARTALGALSALGLAVLPVTGAGAASSAASAVAAVALPAADGPSAWWYDAMGYAEIHRGGTGKGITVAVLDGPVDPDIPELEGKVASSKNMCAAAGSRATSTSDEADHATNIASLVVGGGRGSGVRGIAPEATLRTYTIGRQSGDVFECGARPDMLADAAVAALDAAVKADANVVSISIGGSAFHQPAVIDALARAQRAGVLIVAATNDHDGTVDFPALANGAVSVNYVDRHAKLGAKAPRADQASGAVTVAAPGAAMRMGGHAGHTWRTSLYNWDGSSFATPLVAGGLAAVWSKFPHATANQIIQLMVHTPGLRKGSEAEGGGWFYAFRRPAGQLPAARQSGGGFGWGIFDPADMMQGDPSRYPDVNPELIMSNKVDPAWSAVTGRRLPSSSASTAAAAPARATAHRAGAAASSALGTWILVAVGVVALAAVLVVVLVVTKRGRGAGATARTQEGN